jgi:hypothetical protein
MKMYWHIHILEPKLKEHIESAIQKSAIQKHILVTISELVLNLQRSFQCEVID